MRRFLPSLSALQAFDSAARHMSFTRAADDLMMTQSGVSRQINQLESFLGLRLFERTGSRLTLTDIGRSYAEEVKQTLDRIEEISIDAVRGRKANISVMFGSYPTLISRWLIPRLQHFVTQYPNTPLETIEMQANADIEKTAVDIAILRGTGAWPNARVKELFKEELVVVAAPSLIAKYGDIERLDFERLPTLQNASRPSLWLSWLRATGGHYNGAIQGIRFPHHEMLIQAAVNGLGLALVPIHYIDSELRSGALVPLFGAPVESGESYWTVIPENKAHKPNLLKIRDWLVRSIQQSESTRQMLFQKEQQQYPAFKTILTESVSPEMVIHQ